MSDDGSPNGEKTAEQGMDDREIDRVRTEVIRQLRNRFWFVVLSVALLSYFSVKEIVRQVTETETRAALKAAVLAEDQAKKAATATEEATKITDAYGKSVGVLQQQAVGVQAQFATVATEMAAERANLRASAERTRNNIETRLAKLEELVTKVANDVQTGRQAVEDYRRDIEKAKVSAAAEARRFVENSQYSVSVQFTSATKDLAEKARDVLAKAGFKVAIADIAQAERLTAASANVVNTPTTSVSAAPQVNQIRFTEKAAPKVQEVRDLLAPLVQFKSTEAMRSYGKSAWGDFTSGGNLAWLHEPIPRLVVYLVEKP